MSQNDDEVKNENRRQLFKNVFADPVKRIADGINEAVHSEPEPEKIPRSYQNPEVAKLLESTGIVKDFDDELVAQWAGIQNAYRKMYPDNLKDFGYFLEANSHLIEIEEAKHRYCKTVLDRFSPETLKEINDFYETEFGKKVLKLSDTLRIELRNERTIVAKNLGGRLEATVTEINNRKKV